MVRQVLTKTRICVIHVIYLEYEVQNCHPLQFRCFVTFVFAPLKPGLPIHGKPLHLCFWKPLLSFPWIVSISQFPIDFTSLIKISGRFKRTLHQGMLKLWNLISVSTCRAKLRWSTSIFFAYEWFSIYIFADLYTHCRNTWRRSLWKSRILQTISVRFYS